MPPIKYISITFLFSLVLSGCAGTYKPITDHELASYETASVISNIPQQEIRMQIIPSNSGSAAGAQFGLVGALIGAAVDAGVNNSKANKAEEAIEEFRIALRDVDINDNIHLELQNQMTDLSWANVTNFHQTNVVGNDFVKLPAEKKHKSDVLIVVNSDYSVTPGFETIELTANYWVYAVDEDGSVNMKKGKQRSSGKKPKAFYSNQVVYQAEIFPVANSKRRLTLQEKEAATIELNLQYESKIAAEKNRRRREQLQSERSKELRKLDRKKIAVDSANLNGARWLESEAELTRLALLEGSREIGKLIAMDLSGEANDLESRELITARGIKLYLISKDEITGREIYRAREGLIPGKLISKTGEHDYLLKFGRL